MAQDIVATVLSTYQEAAGAGWAPNTSTNNERTIRPVTAAAVLGNINTRISPNVGAALENCQNINLHWLYPNNLAEINWVSVIQGEDCVVQGGNTVSSKVSTLEPNFSWKSNVTVDTQTCGNAIDAMQLMKENVDVELQKASDGLNRFVLALLEANQAAVPNGTLTQAEGVVVQNGQYVIPDAKYWSSESSSSQIIALIDQIAQENGFGDYYVIQGGSHHAALFNANYDQRNDNQRADFARFGHLEIYEDLRSYFKVAGTKSMFLVEKSVLVAYFKNRYSSENVEMSYDKTTYAFSTPLHYYANFEGGTMATSQLNYNLNGTSTPINVQMRVKSNCGPLDSWGGIKPVLDVEMLIPGLIKTRPIESNAHTGILKIVQSN